MSDFGLPASDDEPLSEGDDTRSKRIAIKATDNAYRFYTDVALPIFLGIDFEVAFFTASPDFDGKEIVIETAGDGQSGRIRLPSPAENRYLEQARLRMNRQTTEQLAFGLILQLLKSRYTAPDEFRALIAHGENQFGLAAPHAEEPEEDEHG